MVVEGRPLLDGGKRGKRVWKETKKNVQILVKKIRNAFNLSMFPLFMDCHGVANVQDTEGPCVVEGQLLISEDAGSHWFHVLLIQCQHQATQL